MRYLAIIFLFISLSLSGCKKDPQEVRECLNKLDIDSVVLFLDATLPDYGWPPTSEVCSVYRYNGLEYLNKIKECVKGYSRQELRAFLENNCTESDDAIRALFDRDLDTRVRAVQAYCDYAGKRYQSAFDLAEECYKENDHCLQVYVESGCYSGKEKEVAENIEGIVGPGSYYYCYMLGKLGKENEAIECFEDKILNIPSVRDDSEFWNTYGKILAQFSNWEQALKAFKEAVQDDNGNIDAIINLGHAYRITGKCYRAIHILEELRKIGSAREDYLIDLAVCYDMMSFPTKAAHICEMIRSDALRVSCFHAIDTIR